MRTDLRKVTYMARCEVCGNEYDKAFEVTAAGERHTFDSFECAIHRMAAVCEHCGCKVIGHGIEVDDQFFCCAHCARESTGADARDRVETASRS
jgi:Rieske Fe-S protein